MSQKLQAVLAVLARYDIGEMPPPLLRGGVTSLIGRTNEGQ